MSKSNKEKTITLIECTEDETFSAFELTISEVLELLNDLEEKESSESDSDYD